LESGNSTIGKRAKLEMNLYTLWETIAYEGELLSSAALGAIPPIVLFVFLQMSLVSGLTADAEKR